MSYAWAVNRCTQCGKEVRISIPIEWVKRFEAILNVKCNVCNSQSRWGRTEDA